MPSAPSLRVVQSSVTVSPGRQPDAGPGVTPETARSTEGASAAAKASVASLLVSAVPTPFCSSTALPTSAVTSARRLPAPALPAGSARVTLRASDAPGASPAAPAAGTMALATMALVSTRRRMTRSTQSAPAGSPPVLVSRQLTVTEEPDSIAPPATAGATATSRTSRSGAGTASRKVRRTGSCAGLAKRLKPKARLPSALAGWPSSSSRYSPARPSAVVSRSPKPSAKRVSPSGPISRQ